MRGRSRKLVVSVLKYISETFTSSQAVKTDYKYWKKAFLLEQIIIIVIDVQSINVFTFFYD